jgi:hypothetical protein
MSRKKAEKQKKSVGIIELDDEFIDRVIDMIQEDLEVPNLGIEERESLERVVMSSVAYYFMLVRETMSKTSRLTQ